MEDEYPFPSIELSDIQDAAVRIQGKAQVTPIFTCSTLDELAGRQLFFKCENFQKGGAFKFRGACNAVSQLTEEQAKNGVVTHSSGNHAQAVALAAKMRGVPAFIVMPLGAPAVKKKGVEGYGAKVIECANELRQATADKVVAETGGSFIHPSNDLNVIAGQGTMALEILSQVEDLDAIIAPIGGGGMISGICVAAKGLKPDIHIFAAEPEEADDAFRSVQEGKLIPQLGTKTIADGLRTGLGSNTWPIVRDKVTAVITVSEEEIKAAMRLVWERMKLVIEPSSGVGLAAVLSPKFKNHPAAESCKRVAIVLCGGNVDLDSWNWN